MTEVLVAYASKMGSTREIAEAIGTRLSEWGLRVTVLETDEVDSVEHYDTVVLGSAVYAARRRPTAVRFVRRHAAALTTRRIWLFEAAGWASLPPG